MGEFLVVSLLTAGGWAAIVTALARFHERQGAEPWAAQALPEKLLPIREQFDEQHRSLSVVCRRGRITDAAAVLISQRIALLWAVRRRAWVNGVGPIAPLSPLVFHSSRVRLLAALSAIAHELAWTSFQRLGLRLRFLAGALAATNRAFANAVGRPALMAHARHDLETVSTLLLGAMAAVERP